LRRLSHSERDMMTLGNAFAAIVMFVGTGSTVLPQVIRSLEVGGLPPDKMLVNALLLNIALIIFGWRRYNELVREIAERRKAEASAQRLAETDPLTGMLNRRGIAEASARLLADCGPRGEILVAIMIDLDNFKKINDLNGHSIGDQVLNECARRIRESLPPHSAVARLGGDEFACVIQTDPRRVANVEQLSSAIIESVAEPVACDRLAVNVTASIGLARSDTGFVRGVEVDPLALLHMADIAMYHAKKQGRNRLSWFEAPMEDELTFRKELEEGIRAGVARGEFVPYYEQQIDIETGELTGFEMLARWHSPVLGEVSPEVFIPVAEDIGMIADLSQSVIAQALEDAKTWHPSLTLAVNISPLQLRDPWFSQKLLKLLLEANFPPQRLEIEITESCLHDNIAIVRSLIASLKNQGIRVTLDDFGTGYSSLAQLRNLPFDRIKIDRSFVTSLPDNGDSAAIVEAIAQLGRGLGLPVTIEGIENERVLDAVRQYGKVKGQGHLYGHPASASETRDTLAGLNLLSGLETQMDGPAARAPDENPPRRAKAG